MKFIMSKEVMPAVEHNLGNKIRKGTTTIRRCIEQLKMVMRILGRSSDMYLSENLTEIETRERNKVHFVFEFQLHWQ